MARFELKGKTVVITGASGGIGSELALAFAKRGAKTVLSGRNVDALNKVKEKVKEISSEVFVVPADVTEFDQMKYLVQRAIELTRGLDVMLLGAGFGVLGDVDKITMQMWHEQMNVNFFGVLNGFYAVLPHLIKQGGGQIIIINSLSGRIAMPLSSAYCASKFALWGFADSARAELARKNIDLICIYPSFVKTGFQSRIVATENFKVPPDLSWRLRGDSPKKVAEAIVRASERRSGEVVFTFYGKLGVRFLNLSYHIAEWGRRFSLPFIRKMMGDNA